MDTAVAVLYTLVLLLVGSGTATRSRILRWSAGCTGLTVLGYGIYFSRGASATASVHLVLSLVVIVATTLLLLREASTRAALAASDNRHSAMLDRLATAIWEHDFTPVARAIASLRAEGVTDLPRYVRENPAFVIEARRTVRITDVNAAALAMMGVPTKQDFFSHLSGFLPEADESFAECIIAIDERRPLFEAETTVLPRIGPPRDVIVVFRLDAEIGLDHVPGGVFDVSERKQLEEQIIRTREELAQVQRSSLLGAISASIAHELNQPLQAIQTYANAASRWMSWQPPNMAEASRALVGLTEAMAHARDVMNRVRGLVGTAREEQVEIDMGQLVTGTVILLRSEAGVRTTRIVVDIDPRPIRVVGDRILLKQVLVNLVANAAQAMACLAPEERIVTLALCGVGGRARIRVADRGPGWGGTRERAFQGFYTTKAEGMGLGLAISRTIVERHEGTISAYDADGGGAVVEIMLPACPVAVADGSPIHP